MRHHLRADRLEKENPDAFAQLPRDFAQRDMARQQRDFGGRADFGHDVVAFDHAARGRKIAHRATQPDTANGDAQVVKRQAASLAASFHRLSLASPVRQGAGADQTG